MVRAHAEWLVVVALALSDCGSAARDSTDAGGDAAPAADGGEPDGGGPDGGDAVGPPPPIQVLFNVHGHNYRLPEEAVAQPDWLDQKLRRYEAHREEILWIADTAERYGVKVSFQLNGEYCRDARTLGVDDTAHIRGLVARGHTVGAHFHTLAYSGHDELWIEYPVGEPLDAATTEAIFRTQVVEVEAALGTQIRHVDAALDWSTEALDAQYAALMAEAGADLEPVGEELTYTPWGHFPWSPFRRALTTALTEDPAGPLLALPTHGQTGLEVPNGIHALVTTVPQLQRHFLALVAMRDWAHRTGRADRPWAIGFLTHPDQNRERRPDVEELMRWLSEEWGHTIELVTDEQAAADFEAWEREHPGASAFSFDWEAWAAGDDAPYPYELPGVVLGLRDAELEAVLEGLPEGLVGFRLQRRLVERSAPRDGFSSILSVGDILGPVWLLWSTEGERVIDLRAEAPGTLWIQDGDTAAIRTADAAELPVGMTPIVVAADASFFAE